MRVPGKSRRKRLADTHPGAKKKTRVEYRLSGTAWGHWDKVLFGGLVIGYELSDLTLDSWPRHNFVLSNLSFDCGPHHCTLSEVGSGRGSGLLLGHHSSLLVKVGPGGEGG